MDKKFEMELVDWISRIASTSESNALDEERSAKSAKNAKDRAFDEARRIGFLWRADFARAVLKTIELHEVPRGNSWYFPSLKKSWASVKHEDE